jgi:hypothetical protein
MALFASARQSGHKALWSDYADTVVGHVSHNDVAIPIHCDSTGKVELSNGPFSVSMALFASARQGGHKALWCDYADTVATRVSHNDVAVPIRCDSIGIAELSNGPFSILMAGLTSASQSGHKALWCNYADTAVGRVSYNDVAVPIHCDSVGIVEPSNGPLSVLMALLTSARQSGHKALWSDFADTVVARVSNDDVAVPIHCDSVGIVEPSNSPLSISMVLLASVCQSGHYHLTSCPFHLT